MSLFGELRSSCPSELHCAILRNESKFGFTLWGNLWGGLIIACRFKNAGVRVIAVIGTPVDRAYPAENKALLHIKPPILKVVKQIVLQPTCETGHVQR